MKVSMVHVAVECTEKKHRCDGNKYSLDESGECSATRNDQVSAKVNERCTLLGALRRPHLRDLRVDDRVSAKVNERYTLLGALRRPHMRVDDRVREKDFWRHMFADLASDLEISTGMRLGHAHAIATVDRGKRSDWAR